MKVLNDVTIKIGEYGVWHKVLTLEIHGDIAKVCWPNQEWQEYPISLIEIQKPMHELFGDEYIEAAFEMWIEECELQVFALFEATRKRMFKQFKAAFMHGLTACSNGNVY